MPPRRRPRTDDRDAIDDYIDVNRHRIVRDEETGNEIILTDHELGILENIQSGKYAAPIIDPYEDWTDWFDFEDRIHPLSAAPEPKRRFIPSKWEAQKVLKLVRAIRRGAIIPKTKDEADKDDLEEKKPYLLWDTDLPPTTPNFMHLAAPRLPLPGHEESYNPPVEYLPSEEEKKAWEEADPELRSNLLPQRFTALRHVPVYDRIVQERFERCLDLYLCPRTRKKRMNVDPNSLLPQLPDPSELKPFPTAILMRFIGHDSAVRAASFNVTGHYIATGDEKGEMRVWEVATGRSLLTHSMSAPVSSIAWRMSEGEDECTSVLAVSAGNDVVILNGGIQNKGANTALLSGHGKGESGVEKSVCEWSVERGDSPHVTLHHSAPVSSLSWHRGGDYLITVAPKAHNRSVLVHRLSLHETQNPFSKHKGIIVTAKFHPKLPVIIVASKQHIRLYHLTKHTLIKKLYSGLSMLSSIDVHASGSHVLAGSFESRVLWFDLDMGNKPFRVLRYHKSGVRSVVYHKKYPLFATAADDGTIHVFHGRVYNDFANPLIVPLKVLAGHEVVNDHGVLACDFHPGQPWLVSGGADGQVSLWG